MRFLGFFLETFSTVTRGDEPSDSLVFCHGRAEWKVTLFSLSPENSRFPLRVDVVSSVEGAGHGRDICWWVRKRRRSSNDLTQGQGHTCGTASRAAGQL